VELETNESKMVYLLSRVQGNGSSNFATERKRNLLNRRVIYAPGSVSLIRSILNSTKVLIYK
jgi:hypothetical protein